MVKISSLPSSVNAVTTPRQQAEASKKKPLWIFAFYALFFSACLNLVNTYQDQKELVRLRVVEEEKREGVEVISYSAGAEEHLVSVGVGSSQYGGSMKAAQSGTKKKKKNLGTTFNGIHPQPSNGSKDYAVNHPPSDFNGFSFYFMADTPYTELEESRLQSQMAELRDGIRKNPQRNITLGIHLGGTQKSSQCAESTYEVHAYLLAKGPRPTFVTPGKSDWFDCPRREEAFGFFMKHMGPGLVSKWHANQSKNLDIQRSDQNPELFRFYAEGILFIGLHMIDPPADQEYISSRDKRMKESMQWFADSIEVNFAKREVRGVVLLGYSGQSERNKKFFTYTRKYFDNIRTRQNIPVLYLHGDGHSWKVDKDESPFYDVQVDQGGLAEPCIVDVAPQSNGKVKSIHKDRHNKDQQVILGKGLFRVDQQGGRYPDP